MMEGCREGAHQASYNKEVSLTLHDSWTARIWDVVGFLELYSKIPNLQPTLYLTTINQAQTARRGVLLNC